MGSQEGEHNKESFLLFAHHASASDTCVYEAWVHNEQ